MQSAKIFGEKPQHEEKNEKAELTSVTKQQLERSSRYVWPDLYWILLAKAAYWDLLFHLTSFYYLQFELSLNGMLCKVDIACS